MTARLSGNRIGVATLIVIVAVPWVLVALTIHGAGPVSAPPTRPNAIVWNGRVFTSVAGLRRWLRSRGASYKAWATAHPEAVAALEHLPPAHAAQSSAGKARPAETKPAAARTVTTGTQREAAPAQHAPGPGWSRRLLFEILGLVAATFLLVVAASPRRLLFYVRPEWDETSVELRFSALAAALSLLAGVAVAVMFGS